MKDILLLHGALGCSEHFTNLIPLLNKHFKVHTLNFSGHGRRPSHTHAFTIQNLAHEVLDYLNEHQLKQVAIFGYSMGGYVALWLARFYPERIAEIYTLGTKLNWSAEEVEKEIKFLNAEKVFEKVPAFAQALAQLHGEHEWKSLMSKTALLMKDLAHTHLTAQDFIKIKHRILLTRGDKDDMVTQEETELVHQLLNTSELKTYPNVVHAIEKVPTLLIAEEIKRFFS